MAEKDWEKSKEPRGIYIKHYWRNKSDGDDVILIVQPRFTNKYVVSREHETLKTFQTESQALSYAKQYMRTH